MYAIEENPLSTTFQSVILDRNVLKIILDGPGPQTCPIPKSYISISFYLCTEFLQVHLSSSLPFLLDKQYALPAHLFVSQGLSLPIEITDTPNDQNKFKVVVHKGLGSDIKISMCRVRKNRWAHANVKLHFLYWQ